MYKISQLLEVMKINSLDSLSNVDWEPNEAFNSAGNKGWALGQQTLEGRSNFHWQLEQMAS